MIKKISEKRNKNKYLKVIAASFLLAIAGMTILEIVIPDQEYSASEKRNLASFPQITWDSVREGDFANQMETYLTDQVPQRDTWVYINAAWNRLMGQNLSNGVYRGKDGYLIQKFHPEEKNLGNETANQLKTFLSRYPQCNAYMMLVPTASEILQENLPNNALKDSQREYFEEIQTNMADTKITMIDLFSTLEEAVETEQIYYKTDHHWTTDGAYVAYQTAASVMGLDLSQDLWESTVLCDDFQGTLMSKSGFYSSTMDEIKMYHLASQDISYVVNYAEEQRKVPTLYNHEGLEGENPYEVFFGGNFPLIQIDTTSSSSRKLLILKDSYANSFVPFLIPYFSEIDLVDARYYAEDLENQMAMTNYTDILVLYNIETYSEDRALQMILQQEEE